MFVIFVSVEIRFVNLSDAKHEKHNMKEKETLLHLNPIYFVRWHPLI